MIKGFGPPCAPEFVRMTGPPVGGVLVERIINRDLIDLMIRCPTDNIPPIMHQSQWCQGYANICPDVRPSGGKLTSRRTLEAGASAGQLAGPSKKLMYIQMWYQNTRLSFHASHLAATTLHSLASARVFRVQFNWWLSCQRLWHTGTHH